jgi:hypothetical protein
VVYQVRRSGSPDISRDKVSPKNKMSNILYVLEQQLTDILKRWISNVASFEKVRGKKYREKSTGKKIREKKVREKSTGQKNTGKKKGK